MALQTCPEDVLLNIASYLHSSDPPEVYCVDLDSRCRVFGTLSLVCRHFYTVFVRLLYRTLCIHYETNTWPKECGLEWYQQNPRRWVTETLLRTLDASPELRSCTRFLELVWDDHSEAAESEERMTNVLGKFQLLRELDIHSSSSPCASGQRRRPSFLLENPLRYLRRLRIAEPIAASMLPHLFFLPSLKVLALAVDPARSVEVWPLEYGAEPGCSTVAHLSLCTALTPSQMGQVLSWPRALEVLHYSHRGLNIHSARSRLLKSLSAGLLAFRHTLTTLYIEIPFMPRNRRDLPNYEVGNAEYDTLLDLRSFTCLQTLSAPSYFFTGRFGTEYDRNNIFTLLSPALRTITIFFPFQDPFIYHDWNSWHRHWGHELTSKYDWLVKIGEECCLGGRFPMLESICIREDSDTSDWPCPDVLSQLFFSKSVWYQRRGLQADLREQKVRLTVSLHVDPDFESEPGYVPFSSQYCCQDDYSPDRWMVGHNGGPMFAEEETVYSDSVHGSDDWESEREDELLEHEAWEQFDQMMGVEYAKAGRVWSRGQEPPYEETKEERDEFYECPVGYLAVRYPRG